VTSTRRIVLTLALAAVLGGAAACSSASVQVADKIRSAAATQLKLSEGEVHATCPDDAEAKEGSAFDCEIRVEDQALTAHIQFTSDERFDFTVDGQVFQRRDIEAQVKQQLESDTFLGATIAELHCGDHELVVIQKAQTITCRGKDANGSEGGAVVALDESGNAVVQSISN
jgi:hypothetical protein